MQTRIWLEIGLVAVMTISVIGFFINRTQLKRGLGIRQIQFLAVALLLPMTVILALENVLMPETVGTLLGAVAGYVLSGIAKEDSE